MLILTRKAVPGDNEILIGETVRIEIIENNRGKISIGIQAPKEISIVRGEIADKYQPKGEVA